jgi:hypothetical protein
MLIEFNFQGDFSIELQNLFQDTQLNDLDKICRYLEVDPKILGQIKYFVFDTHQGKIDADPNHSISRAVARYNENAVYRFWDKEEDLSFPHELTHLVAHHFAAPYKLHTEVDQANGEKLTINIEMVSTCFMQEGLAIAVDDILFKRKLREDGEYKFTDDWCREQFDKMPKSLTEAMKGFETIPNRIIIPFTASFSKFLLNKYGIEKYRQVYIGQKETQTIEENIIIVEGIYNLSSERLWDYWKQSL